LFHEIGNLDSHKKAASSSHSAFIIDFQTDILGGTTFEDSDYPSVPSDEEEGDDSWKKSTSILAKRTGTIFFDNFSPKSLTIRPELLVFLFPTSKIAHLISALVNDLEEEIRSPEEAEEVKVYDMNQAAAVWNTRRKVFLCYQGVSL